MAAAAARDRNVVHFTIWDDGGGEYDLLALPTRSCERCAGGDRRTFDAWAHNRLARTQDPGALRVWTSVDVRSSDATRSRSTQLAKELFRTHPADIRQAAVHHRNQSLGLEITVIRGVDAVSPYADDDQQPDSGGNKRRRRNRRHSPLNCNVLQLTLDDALGERVVRYMLDANAYHIDVPSARRDCTDFIMRVAYPDDAIVAAPPPPSQEPPPPPSENASGDITCECLTQIPHPMRPKTALLYEVQELRVTDAAPPPGEVIVIRRRQQQQTPPCEQLRRHAPIDCECGYAHVALHLGNNYYLSKWGSTGTLAVSRLDQLLHAYADASAHIALGVPKCAITSSTIEIEGGDDEQQQETLVHAYGATCGTVRLVCRAAAAAPENREMR